MNKTIYDYFKIEWKTLLIVTITGIIYNIGLVLVPLFEGKLTGCLYDILQKQAVFSDMFKLVILYLISIFTVQFCRYLKRNYVRVFANNTNKRMKETLFHNLIYTSHKTLIQEGIGNILTKAISDVDDCSEGMRKFTTEIFDTGIALCAYVCMLFYYDYKIAFVCIFFTPFSYIFAEKMKGIIQKLTTKAKLSATQLNAVTLDRATNAITYRVYGRETHQQESYETYLSDYEHTNILSSLPIVALPPLYKSISIFGIFFILYFGSQNIFQGTWNIAIFTTYISCFMKMADKSSKSAKLFNAVHKAQVSYSRIQKYVQNEATALKNNPICIHDLSVKDLSFSYPNSTPLLNHISFDLHVGQIIGITGPVACGKTTFGKLFLNEWKYSGQILFNQKDLSSYAIHDCISYLGHEPQLFDDTIENNIALGDPIDVLYYLKLVCMDEEVQQMEDGVYTKIGNSGMRLSGGQQQRVALARTLAHASSILILDDPFSALDIHTEETIFQNLKKLASDKIILLISHRLHIFNQTNQVLFINHTKGYVGTHSDLLKTNSEYKQLYTLQEGDQK